MNGEYAVTWPPDIDHRARSCYDDLDLATAVQIAKERIDEWVYEADPHGYCHERSVLVALVTAVVALLPPDGDDQ